MRYWCWTGGNAHLIRCVHHDQLEFGHLELVSHKDGLTPTPTWKSIPPLHPHNKKKKSTSSDSRTNSMRWHSRMPIITSRAHQSGVQFILFRCMPFDHHCRLRPSTHILAHVCAHITESEALKCNIYKLKGTRNNLRSLSICSGEGGGDSVKFQSGSEFHTAARKRTHISTIRVSGWQRKRPRILPVSWERVLFLPMLPAWCIAPYLSLIVLNPLPLSRLLQAPLRSAPVRVFFSWFSIFSFSSSSSKGSPLALRPHSFARLSCSLLSVSSVRHNPLAECRRTAQEERFTLVRCGSAHSHTCSCCTAEMKATH